MKEIKRFTMFAMAMVVAGGINLINTKSVHAVEVQPSDKDSSIVVMNGNKFLQVNPDVQDNQTVQGTKPTQDNLTNQTNQTSQTAQGVQAPQTTDDSKPADSAINAVTGDDVVEYAKQLIGIPYRAGGTTTAGFDCSGYTSYVFKHFNVDLPRIAADQTSVGAVVNKADLQPGDLVFFGKSIYHVGIYVGNGQFIHSPKPGEKVRIMDMKYMPDYNTARRVTLPQQN